jgi:hypothetical protein
MTKFSQMGATPTRVFYYFRFFFAIIALISAIFLSSSSTQAMQSAYYQISPGNVFSGGEQGASTNYSAGVLIGAVSGISFSSASYAGINGIPVFSLTQTATSVDPLITEVEFNGREIESGDYIIANATLTALILSGSLAAVISPEASFVIVDGYRTAFDNLLSPSSFNLSTGDLEYLLALSDGVHYITIEAANSTGGSAAYTRQIMVANNPALQALQVGAYPNPYRPSSGNLKIGYQLTKASNITLYIFNEIKQPVLKKVFLSDSAGGRAGYNEYDWNGVTDFKLPIPGGAYLIYLVADNKVIGRTKLAVIR